MSVINEVRSIMGDNFERHDMKINFNFAAEEFQSWG